MVGGLRYGESVRDEPQTTYEKGLSDKYQCKLGGI